MGVSSSSSVVEERPSLGSLINSFVFTGSVIPAGHKTTSEWTKKQRLELERIVVPRIRGSGNKGSVNSLLGLKSFDSRIGDGVRRMKSGIIRKMEIFSFKKQSIVFHSSPACV